MLIESGGTLFSPTSCSCESSATNLRLRSALGDEHEGDQARAVITKTQTSHKEERGARVAKSKESSFVHLWQHAVRGATVLAAFLPLKKERRHLRHARGRSWAVANQAQGGAAAPRLARTKIARPLEASLLRVRPATAAPPPVAAAFVRAAKPSGVECYGSSRLACTPSAALPETRLWVVSVSRWAEE